MDTLILKYIEQLLYTHDCVIVPNFGGFIVNYVPANIHFIEGQIHPPRKRVSFNQKLTTNDGLLANHIAQMQNLPYKVAVQKIEQFVQQLGLELVRRQVLQLPTIGKLYFNSEAKLEFVPESTNFLRDAYGLPSIQATPIIRQRPIAEPSHTVAAPAMSVQVSPRTAAVSGVVLLAILPLAWWIFSNPTAQHNASTTQHASTLPTEFIRPTPQPLEDNPVTVESEPTEPTTDEDTARRPVPRPNLEKSANAQTYVIVIGAFSDQANAKRTLRKLENEGYFPDLATTHNGLQRIGIQITCSPNELNLHLADIRKKFNKKAWVIKE